MAAFKFFSRNKNNNGKSKKDVTNFTKNIDYNMHLSEKREQRTIRLLLLGPGDAGKTTIVKQMKKIHETLSDDDIKIMAPYIQDAVVGYIKLLCFQSKELHDKDDQKTSVKEANEPLRQEIVNMRSPYLLNEELAVKITTLWQDPGIKETLNLRSRFQIHDNVAYFLDKIHDICQDDYTPDFEDYLRIRTRSTGFNMEKVTANIDNFGEYMFEFTDVGGQRSERKKWMKIVADQIQAVLYVVAIAEYDMKCFEDNNTNRLVEALNLFKEIVGGERKFFHNKSVLVFFNKYDLFKEKIKTVPITEAFPDFPVDESDPHDENQVVKYIASQFLQCFEGKNIKLASPLHIHRTSALDTGNIQKVFRDITLDLVKSNLKDVGMI
mmetsp:Transcript_28049/g.44494  ORF Transcript_28049/g.44494 Transcript_28049/m.44494 type:complete len:380 (-) Transcript_28049:189-1328(-)|eukprot:CAMPEP_0197046726 /NCGR_PEP_ID=MMETSP1384-20130603/22386_1 /TAXON_ID=29189 /ORGANISM="Ammonia sp." /LENGTH=379 /DNA_ID=CAMNT_0042478561 /DNA_START=22 /DNA_END=1161 /DNA_ORIENTATION=-